MKIIGSSRQRHSGRREGAGGPPRAAFTLIELLVVIAIIAILASILVPAVQTALGRAQMIACQQRLHGVGTASHIFAGDHEGRFASNTMIHGQSNEENDPFAHAMGQDNLTQARESGLLVCPTALKVGLQQGIERRKISFAGNRNNYWSLDYREGTMKAYGWYPNTYQIDIAKPTQAGFAFCGDGRWWMAADGQHFGQQPTFLHMDSTIANMPNINFMSGKCNALFADGHALAMRPGWGDAAVNPESDQIPCERPNAADRDAWNAFWWGK